MKMGSPDEKARAEAADWFARMNSDAANAGTAAALRDWLGQNRANAEAYLEQEMLWAEMAQLADDPRLAAHRRAALDEEAPQRPTFWSVGRLAAATTALAACLAISVAVILLQLPEPVAIVDDYILVRHETQTGERLTVALPDRSEITLAPASQVEVLYREQTRDIRLVSGRAFFSVARDLNRPFRVEAEDRVVTALGTRFQVALDEAAPEVLLVDGLVEVSGLSADGTGPVYRLQPGQRLSGAMSSALVEQVDADEETAWRSGQLVFRNQPLRDVAAEFSRYAPVNVRVADTSIGDLRVSGVFHYEQVGAFASALQRTFDIEVERAEDGSYLLQIGRAHV